MQDSLLLLIVIACPSHLGQRQFLQVMFSDSAFIMQQMLTTELLNSAWAELKNNANTQQGRAGLIRPLGEAVGLDYIYGAANPF